MKYQGYLLLLIFSLVATACSTSAGVPEVVTNENDVETAPLSDTVSVDSPALIHIVDSLGRQVTLDAPPQRIVVTGKALIMILDAVYVFPAAPQRIAAFGDAAQGSTNFIALVDGDYGKKAVLEQNAGAEQIAAVHPDLVVAKSVLVENLGQPLEALGIPVIYVDFETPEQYTRDLLILGQVFQDEDRAQEVVEYYQDQVDQVEVRLAGVVEKPTTLLLYYTDKDGAAAFNVPPSTWMQTRLVEMAGGDPVWESANPGKGWSKISLEQIAAWDADHILIVSYTEDPSTVISTLLTDPQWQALRAVQEKHLTAFPGDLYSWDQPDVRWILGLTWLARHLHPEQFQDVDMFQQAFGFYQRLYGVDRVFFDKNILPVIRDLP